MFESAFVTTWLPTACCLSNFVVTAAYKAFEIASGHELRQQVLAAGY